MKLFNKYFFVIGIGAVSLASCKKEYLSPVPETFVADVSAFSTVGRIDGQLLSLYGSLKSGSFYGGRYLIYGDIRGEDFMNETGNLVTGSDVWALNPTNSATAVLRLWSSAYSVINNVNIFLEGMEAEGKAVVGDAKAGNYMAEAKLLRAISYFALIQYYARPYADGNGSKLGVPLRLTAIKGAGQSPMARSTVAEVYTQILKDLNEAEAGLPLNYSGTTNLTRAHRNTAIALKTRVYLAMQQYANVVTEANKIVSANAPFTATTGVQHSLFANINTLFTNYTNTEMIFSMPMTSTGGDNPGTQNQLAYYFSPSTANGGVGNGEYSLNANGIIADPTWKDTDSRRGFIKQSGSGSTFRNWSVKFNLPTPFTDYVPVIRYAEVLLNLAEAKVRASNSVDAQAIALLNAVRNRSDATTVYTVADFATPADLANAILKERRIEFLGEGIRALDILRLLQTFPAKGTAQAKTPSDAGYIWPISSDELSINTLATDN